MSIPYGPLGRSLAQSPYGGRAQLARVLKCWHGASAAAGAGKNAIASMVDGESGWRFIANLSTARSLLMACKIVGDLPTALPVMYAWWMLRGRMPHCCTPPFLWSKTLRQVSLSTLEEAPLHRPSWEARAGAADIDLDNT